MSLAGGPQADLLEVVAVEVAVPEAAAGLVARSPGRLAWLRLRRDRTAMVSGATLLLFLVVGVAAPVIRWVYGVGPDEQFQHLTDVNGMPLGYAGGVSGDHWLGLEPSSGHDIFVRLVYGLRTSLLIAFTAAVIATVIGVVVGIVAGYLGGWVDTVVGWVTDFVLALPFLIFCLATIPVVQAAVYTPREAIPAGFRIGLIIAVFALFSWTYTARLVRGQVLSLREREFVEAARAAGAGTPHILFAQLLPNLWAPILVAFSLAVPAFVTGEAALSFINVGVTEPTPDLGRMIFRSIPYLQSDPTYTLVPGIAIFVLVLAFNLFGDSLRDALDPKSAR